jgi:ankyrin repeat protein
MALDFVRKGETDCLAPMLDAGMPVNLSDEKGNSLLMLASYNEHFESSKMLLEHGAEADRRNDHGQSECPFSAITLFHEAAGR